MINAHTPGPWTAHECNTVISVSSEGYGAVCNIYIHAKGKRLAIPVRERFANARLIAAAPDLLAALTYVLPWLEAHIGQGLSAHELDNIRATIAKATGEETNA